MFQYRIFQFRTISYCCILVVFHFMASTLLAGNKDIAEKKDNVSTWLSPLDPWQPRYTERDNVDFTGYFVAQGKRVPIKGNVGQLKYFFDALNSAKSKKIHIAHWGDSVILGDIISEGLRDNLQKQFGGTGIGFMSMNCDDFGMRSSTMISFSNDWKEASIVKRNPDHWPIGINGYVFSPTKGSWAKFEIGPFAKIARTFPGVRLFYASAPSGSVVKYHLSNGTDQNARLESGADLKELDISLPADITSIKFTFDFAGGFFYGVSFENGSGVYVDNLPIRGNTGVGLADIQVNLLKEFNRKMNYKLLILNFGINVISPEHNNYIWYEQRMEKVVNILKEAFPQASILVVSVGDKGVKKGTRFVTDPGIPALLRTQQNIADKSSCAFWNLFETMGGENSVVDWVDANPPGVEKDYCHLTKAGGKVISDLLFEQLLKEKK